MRSKKSAVLIPVLALTIALGGCGQEVVLDGTETAATLDGTTNMTLGEFNLLLRYQEAQMETYYGSMFGTSNIYAQDMTGSGTIYGETAKETLIDQFREMYVLEAEAPNYGVELTDEEKSAITEAAAKFLEDNTEEVKNDLGVDQNSVERFLTLAAIQDKMYDALTADVDTEVSDEEAAQKRIAYVYISASGTETDENGNTKTEKKEQTILHITVTSKSVEEMINLYNFNTAQQVQLAELRKEEYASLWNSAIYGTSSGSQDIVQVAKQQIGNIGGQPYWSWYGFTSRVEWCACFVSWCAEQCGYIQAGIIPKFASVNQEGVPFFKAIGLWKDGGYSPKGGDIIFFDWENDGTADHVGIVEKTENGIVYTIEGNTTGDMCKQNEYNVDSSVILGYGTPAY